MQPSEVHSNLNTFTNFESQLHKLAPEDFSLNRIQKFLDLAGNPAQKLKIIHVAGTKGKGSTCAFLASILQQAGYKVGLYTSPHLHKINERIRVFGGHFESVPPKGTLSKCPLFEGSITDEELASVMTFLRPFAATVLNEGHVLTFFEVMTVAALYYFARSGVDIVILETGLGGRLDATNVVYSAVGILTPVSLDHIKILGSTPAKIAAEKAGIIKSSLQKVVIAPQTPQVMEVMLARCQEFGIQPVLVDMSKYESLKTGLKGRHQKVNAAAAIETINILKGLGFKITDEAMAEGLKAPHWPGRFEVMRHKPDVVIDAAHNEASAVALSETLNELYAGRRIIFVIGLSQDKDAGAFLKALKDNAQQIFLTKAQSPRASMFTAMEAKSFLGSKPFEITDNIHEALSKALSAAGPEDVVVITGSIFIVAEAREHLCTNTKA